jgi:CPA2 family monovalent cation:H+ antiporter-2
MATPETDIHGRAFNERDKKLLGLLLRPGGARHAVERILHHARAQNPAVSSIVSAADDLEILPFSWAGAGTVFPENFAAGLALADQVLLVCGFSQDNTANIVTTVRAELNPELRGRVGL